MVKEGHSKQDIHHVARLLEEVGWTKKDNFPEGWYVKIHRKGGIGDKARVSRKYLTDCLLYTSPSPRD